jgi:ABC-type protease/lipase transport system fused ATPase/permease subunit
MARDAGVPSPPAARLLEAGGSFLGREEFCAGLGDTNRIDVELGGRLFHHLFRLPLAYFETRPAGQTVARMRELESIRSFLTGQGLTSLLDLVFALVFIGVMFIYSLKLTLAVIATVAGLSAGAGVGSAARRHS